MNFLSINLKWIAIGAGAFVMIVLAIWFLFFRSSAQLISTLPTTVDFGESQERAGETGGAGGVGAGESGLLNEALITQDSLNQKIFKVADGPIASVVLIQTSRPTTTLARYIKADNGRVFDLPLDIPGALPRAVSNTTIPGILRSVWLQDGSGVLLQYESSGVRKTLSLGLLNATTTLSASANPQPTYIQYLPDNIVDFAVSPNGTSIVYLLQTQSGVDGYTAKSDGTNPKKLFSLPLSQVLVSWPSTNALLVQTKVAYGVLGVAFSIDVKTGSVSTLFFANGLNAIADQTFSRVIYQTVLGSGVRMTYVHDILRNTDRGLSFSPIPEKCVWGGVATSTLYCANPLEYVPINYLDLWHAGTASVADSILSFNISTGASSIRATPGREGGVPSDIVSLSISPDERYASYVSKGERVLWGVRLAQ